MAKICLVHLVRARNGMEPFEQFVKSYETHDAGVSHDLLFILKGFRSEDELTPYRDRVSHIAHREVRLRDKGFDIAPYFKVVSQFQDESFCFLNSFSRILVDGWLEHLYGQLGMPGVGLVGATASWGSPASEGVRRFKRLIRAWPWYERPPRKVLHWWRLRHFDLFPNYHIRTNAFMARTETLRSVHRHAIRWKGDAFHFESGRHGLTQQVLAMGLKAVVVGKDARGYDLPDWPDSETFWQRDQRNLLVADNQTEKFRTGSDPRRRYLSRFAWGDRAQWIAPPYEQVEGIESVLADARLA